MGIFSKKSGTVTNNYIWVPKTMLSFRKKTNKPIPRKVTERRMHERTDRRKDGQTLFYRTLPAETGGPKKVC